MRVRISWRWVGMATGAALMAAAVWLLTADVHVDVPRDLTTDDSFCGSAYDVVLLRGDGDMGGEPSANQDRIDRACVRASGRYVVAGTTAGAAGVMLVGFVGLDLAREERRVRRARRAYLTP